MRLIDADRLIKRLERDPLFPLVEKYGLTRVIDAVPTVDIANRVSKEKYEASEDARKILVEFADDLLAELKERVEVVRCEDCKWWKRINDYDGIFGHCEHIEMIIDKPIFINKDFFCAEGERREEK